MKKLILIVLVLIINQSGYQSGYQANEPPKIPEIKKPSVAMLIVPATISAKSGELVVIDAKAAKGDVLFVYDKKVFDVKHALILGKSLILTAPTNKETKLYIIVVTSWDDRTQNEVAITIIGTDGPSPLDPNASPIDKLSAKVDTLAKAVTDANKTLAEVNKTVSGLDKRVLDLEQKPIPPPPTDTFTKAIKDAYIADGSPRVKMALLASVYRNSSKITMNATMKTTLDIQATMHNSIIGLIDDKTDLQNVRKVIQAEMKRVEGANVRNLTQAIRDEIDAQFTRFAKALDAVDP